MDDAKIVDLYWQRSEQAIPETASKYGHYCYSVAHRIVNNREDSEECANDTTRRSNRASGRIMNFRRLFLFHKAHG